MSSGLLSSLQPRNVVWRNCSSAVSSAYSISHTSLGRTHWIFSLMLGGLTKGHLSVKSGFIRSTASFRPTDIALIREREIPGGQIRRATCGSSSVICPPCLTLLHLPPPPPTFPSSFRPSA